MLPTPDISNRAGSSPSQFSPRVPGWVLYCLDSIRLAHQGIYFFVPQTKGQFTTTVGIGDSEAAPASLRMGKRLPLGLGT